jgi:hypothetical protein
MSDPVNMTRVERHVSQLAEQTVDVVKRYVDIHSVSREEHEALKARVRELEALLGKVPRT